jgi:hypothetical protein
MKIGSRTLSTTAKSLAAVFAFSLLAVVASASPASAAIARCVVVTTHCETGSVHADSGHKIYLDLAAGSSLIGASWRVVDTSNGRIVGHGFTRATYPFPEEGSIGGLYSSYRLEIYGTGPGSTGIIADYP